MTLDRAALQGAIARLAAAMERDFDMLNTADGALGDGDLGVTMTRGMRLVAEKAGGLPADLGQALLVDPPPPQFAPVEHQGRRRRSDPCER